MKDCRKINKKKSMKNIKLNENTFLFKSVCNFIFKLNFKQRQNNKHNKKYTSIMSRFKIIR